MIVNLIKKHPKYSICLVSIILATTLFIVFIDSYYDSFKNNIIPEIVGIAIELVIIIFVLGLFTSKQETNRQTETRTNRSVWSGQKWFEPSCVW